MGLDKGRIDWMPIKKIWRTVLYVGNKDVVIGDFKTRDEAINALQIAIKWRKHNMPVSVRIPERVLSWRERQRKGSIMRPKTFKRIKGKARRTGYRVPSAVGGKAYYVTLLSKYLDTHPKDVGVKILLSRLVKRRGKIRKNVPPHIKDEILKWHWAGKKHVHIANLINKKYGLNLTVVDIRRIVFGQKNPVSQPTLIYDKLLGIEARKQHGKFKGENFRHDFKHDTDAVVMGNPDGSLTIRSKKGKRLWKRFNY